MIVMKMATMAEISLSIADENAQEQSIRGQYSSSISIKGKRTLRFKGSNLMCKNGHVLQQYDFSDNIYCSYCLRKKPLLKGHEMAFNCAECKFQMCS